MARDFRPYFVISRLLSQLKTNRVQSNTVRGLFLLKALHGVGNAQSGFFLIFPNARGYPDGVWCRFSMTITRRGISEPGIV